MDCLKFQSLIGILVNLVGSLEKRTPLGSQ